MSWYEFLSLASSLEWCAFVCVCECASECVRSCAPGAHRASIAAAFLFFISFPAGNPAAFQQRALSGCSEQRKLLAASLSHSYR